MQLSRGQLALFRTAAGLLAVGLALGGAELTLRLTGHQPWRPFDAGSQVPVMHGPDPVLGWQARPGRYLVPPYTPDATPIPMTFLDGGARLTGAASPAARDRLVTVGCSYTQGWAIADDQTFAWKLQQRYPSLRVANHGTAGYGTYQSLLKLERLFAEPSPPPVRDLRPDR